MRNDLAHLTETLADRYRIERELGAGGMATVYLAHDVRHDRKVALKVLRPELAAILGADRFLQEIKTTANLQHPHILPLHDSGEVDGVVFYVMPFVEGESLRDRLHREHQLPVEDALRITTEVASALDYAHRHGVVHRDIKPENILLHDGQALVADFGIALAVSRSEGATRMTETGMSLGTPHYMSPEQAMGEREITPRSDVYALGCVLYEMLTGEPPFTGSTAQAIVARVLTEEPRPITAQRRTVPPHVEAAVITALEKLPADRFPSAADFAAAIAGKTVSRPGTGVRSATIRSPLSLRVAVATAVAAAGFAVWGWLRPRPEPSLVRYTLGLRADQALQQGLLGVNIAISPDGQRFVYLGPGERNGRLWLKERDRLDPIPLAGTEGAINPTFSPDGRHIAFSAGTAYTLKVIATDGGPPLTLVSEPGALTGAAGGLAWSDDGWIYFDVGSMGYSRVRPNGGKPEPVMALDSTLGEIGLAWPQVLPGGKQLLIRSRRGLNPDDFQLLTFDLSTHRRHVIGAGLIARYLAPGFLVYVRADGTLMGARFQPGDTALRSPAVPLAQGIGVKVFGSVDLALSSDGTLLYVPGSASGAVGEGVWVSRDGDVSALQPPLAIGSSANRGLALSPDGTRLAVDNTGDRSVDIWVKQLPGGPFSRLTFDGTVNIRPSWTADGRSLLFISNRDSAFAVWQQRADGSRPAELVLRTGYPVTEAQISRDGGWLVYRVTGTASRDIYGVHLGAGQDTTPVRLLTSRFNEQGLALSPDGRWLAYVSDESGVSEVYVRPFPRTDLGRWQVSTGGGTAPRWSHSGRELFYLSGIGDMMVAAVTSTPTFSPAAPRRLFTLGSAIWPSNVVPYYDLSPDDRRFIMVRVGSVGQSAGAGAIVVVENWRQELEAKVGATHP